jgi:hypothetical protein
VDFVDFVDFASIALKPSWMLVGSGRPGGLARSASLCGCWKLAVVERRGRVEGGWMRGVDKKEGWAE